jgi:hypothetical protein
MSRWPYRQNALATTLVALVHADYYPRIVTTAFDLLLGSRSVTYYPSNYPKLLLP